MQNYGTFSHASGATAASPEVSVATQGQPAVVMYQGSVENAGLNP